MLPFIVDAKELLSDTGSSVEIDGVYPLETLVFGDETFTLLEPASVQVTVSNASSGLVAYGRASARVRATCARCLCEFETDIGGEVEGFYVSANASGPDAADAERVSSDGRIDLGPAIIAALVIEAPFVPLHDPDCAGLCPECGADLNEQTCECAATPDESHPFAALKELLRDADPSGPCDADAPTDADESDS